LEAAEGLRLVQAAMYVGLAVAATRVWRRERGRPAAYLAAAFVALGAVTAIGVFLRRFEPDELQVLRDLNVVLLLSFAWLLAAAVWSFVHRQLPRWLRAAGVLLGAIALLSFALPPLGQPGERSVVAQLYVLAALVVWLTLLLAAAVRLWRAGDQRQRVVRARTRAMAAGAVGIGLVLIASANVQQSPGVSVTFSLLTITSAVLFGIGYVPPRLLRWWWRQLPASRIAAMQTELIAASTPQEVAAAFTPVIAEMYGGAVMLGPGGRLLGAGGLPDDEVQELTDLVRARVDVEDVHVVDVEGYCLAVRTSPYAPLFAESEERVLREIVLLVRLALERAELQASTEAARAETQRAYDDQQALLVGLAHDLRSPAVTISTYSSLISAAEDLEDAKQMAEGLAGSAGYLDRLVDGISELSRIGRNDGHPEPIALAEVVGHAATRARATHPDLQVDVSPDLPTVVVDRLRIEQVFDNLIGNAAKHGGRDDLTVSVHTEPLEGGGVRVVVADDGAGVPEREREEVFALFRRGSGAGGQGSGVGLGLCRRIVESYGGQIRFAPVERGARAEVDLPAAVVSDEPAADPAELPPARPTLGGRLTEEAADATAPVTHGSDGPLPR
jgi:signal transduction histidine kinase